MSKKEYIEREVAIQATTLEVLGDPHPTEAALIATVHKKLCAVPAADVVSMGEFEELRATLDATIAGQVTLQEALAKANGDIKGIFSEMENAMRLGLIAIRGRLEVKGRRSIKAALLAEYNAFACAERFVAELKKKYLEMENDS